MEPQGGEGVASVVSELFDEGRTDIQDLAAVFSLEMKHSLQPGSWFDLSSVGNDRGVCSCV